LSLARKATAELQEKRALVASRNVLGVYRQILSIRQMETEQEVEEWVNSGI